MPRHITPFKDPLHCELWAFLPHPLCWYVGWSPCLQACKNKETWCNCICKSAPWWSCWGVSQLRNNIWGLIWDSWSLCNPWIPDTKGFQTDQWVPICMCQLSVFLFIYFQFAFYISDWFWDMESSENPVFLKQPRYLGGCAWRFRLQGSGRHTRSWQEWRTRQLCQGTECPQSTWSLAF